MPPATSTFIRTPAFRAVTIGLILAYLIAALAFARPGQVVNFGWPGQFGFGLSLVLGVLILYGGAWLSWRRIDSKPLQNRTQAGWRGAAYGVLILLATVVLVGGYNAIEDVLHFAPFPGTTTADFYQRLGDEWFNYIVKPLAHIMPLGGLVAGLLGWWVGRRTANSST